MGAGNTPPHGLTSLTPMRSHSKQFYPTAQNVHCCPNTILDVMLSTREDKDRQEEV